MDWSGVWEHAGDWTPSPIATGLSPQMATSFDRVTTNGNGTVTRTGDLLFSREKQIFNDVEARLENTDAAQTWMKAAVREYVGRY